MKGQGLGQMQHSMNNLFLESHKNKYLKYNICHQEKV